MDINIQSQIVVKTAAAWALDATVYSAQRILVTSDATYGATDQRKFKIADGVQTWTNLNYFPVSGYDDATSSIQTQLNGKQATLTNPVTGTGTNNEIAYFNSTGSTIASLTTGTYPSLTELSYVKGVTSSIQAQLNSKKISTFQFQSASFSPADSTTYRITPIIASTVVTTGTAPRVRIKLNDVASSWTLHLTYNLNVVGSNEGTILKVRNHTQSTEANFTTTLDLSVQAAALVYTATLSCAVGDEIELLMVTPVYVTNPTAFLATFFLSF